MIWLLFFSVSGMTCDWSWPNASDYSYSTLKLIEQGNKTSEDIHRFFTEFGGLSTYGSPRLIEVHQDSALFTDKELLWDSSEQVELFLNRALFLKKYEAFKKAANDSGFSNVCPDDFGEMVTNHEKRYFNLRLRFFDLYNKNNLINALQDIVSKNPGIVDEMLEMIETYTRQQATAGDCMHLFFWGSLGAVQSLWNKHALDWIDNYQEKRAATRMRQPKLTLQKARKKYLSKEGALKKDSALLLLRSLGFLTEIVPPSANISDATRYYQG